jgi:hypothetical protein
MRTEFDLRYCLSQPALFGTVGSVTVPVALEPPFSTTWQVWSEILPVKVMVPPVAAFATFARDIAEAIEATNRIFFINIPFDMNLLVVNDNYQQ